MLTNLQQIYLRQSDTVRTAGCLDRILALYPDSAEHRRSRGLLRLQLGFEAAAIDDLESYLELAPDCVDRASIQGWIESARRSGVLIN
jgi:regulator of sirC expression with transglutaminase-like and TPR domain